VTRLRAHTLTEKPDRPSGVDPRAVVTVLRVPPECEGMRLDRFVQSQLKRTSRTRAQAIVKASAFAWDGSPVRSSDRVRGEQMIMLWRAPWDEEVSDQPLTILFEDEHLLAIDKPAGVPVHPTARYYRSTVVKLLEAVRPGDIQRLAHRLDRDTSGVLLLSKTSEADKHVKRQFAMIDPWTGKPAKTRTVEKIYLAVSHGHPAEERFTIPLPLEEDVGNALRVKMRVAAEGCGLTATTHCELRGRYVDGTSGRPFSLIACALETGRQHQIRVHLAAVGLPIVGDKLYGADDRLHARGSDGTLTEEDLAGLILPRHALHAHVLELEHPLERGRRVRIEAPLAADLAAFLAGLTHVA
jgi:23S rRNA pseudouridine1911/1915/1917 synthase